MSENITLETGLENQNSNFSESSGSSNPFREKKVERPLVLPEGLRPTTIEAPSASDLDAAFAREMASREALDDALDAADPRKTDDERLAAFESLIRDAQDEKDDDIVSYYLEQIYPGNMSDQGRFIKVPLDFHSPGMFEEDRFTTIHGNDKITTNGNSEMFQQINGTEVTKGMMEFSKGNKWNSGLICYNKNCIIVRDGDNNYGQPGFLQGVFFYNRLGVEIMKRYLVRDLIDRVNNEEFSNTSDPREIRTSIVKMYNRVHESILDRLEDGTEDSNLFSDELPEVKVQAPLTGDARKLKDLERKVNSLESTVSSLQDTINRIQTALNLTS